MKRLLLGSTLVVVLVGAGFLALTRNHRSGQDAAGVAVPAYVDTVECASCHPTIYETFQQTGMGRSFYRPTAANTIEDYRTNNTFHHAGSDRYYTMVERDGRYFQRRHQLGSDGRPFNIIEKEVHYILGSGNHARTYLHLDAQKQLVELPVGWYAENGGYWGMNPGYDRPDHPDFRRKLTLECIFCHNAYPELGKDADRAGSEAVFNGKIPEGIDCQRCHGPGGDHVRAAQAQGTGDLETIRKAIVNPGRLSPDRSFEVCMQCHLESTSFRLPYSVRRAGRGLLSYVPGQTLSDYMIHFDHPAGAGYDDKFEIVNQVYRLRKSACFQESAGAMTCTTCHNPHEKPSADQATGYYAAACKNCHAARIQELTIARKHPVEADCVSCHMPKRRTEDVVHVVMTDHYIQRRKPARDLLAPIVERHDEVAGRTNEQAAAYKGEVGLYYPDSLPPADADLYLAVAQVKQNANLKDGIRRLRDAIEKYKPAQGEFYFEMAEAYAEDGSSDLAIPMYQETISRLPDFWPALHKLGLAYTRSGQPDRAIGYLEQAARLGTDAILLSNLALAYRQMGRVNEAVATLRKAVSLDPELSQAFNNLGGMLRETADLAGAEDAFRQAIRSQPDFAAAHANLANLLFDRGDVTQAQYHYEKAIEQDPSYIAARLDYSRALARMESYARAEAQLEQVIRLNPNLVEVHNTLGDLLAVQGRMDRAQLKYREALRINPSFGPAHFSLGLVLASQGKNAEALASFQRAAESPDPTVRQPALEAILRLTRQ